MEKRLKKLQAGLKKTYFNHLSFTAEHRKEIMKKIQIKNKEEEILLAALQLLHTRKTGFELTELLRARGFQKFENQEGFIYTFLHRLEQRNIIASEWDNNKVKYYQIDRKGKKLEKKLAAEGGRSKNIRELIDWVYVNE
ncbi:hypothetical protein CHH55_00330 [Niallia circulans]|jgi:DNA-binding PadR family transcriptional regulator|uniref:PadR family transcriptional regulator n=1 Tax=Niallia TaxID=2837506 RepID=UPI000BA5AF5E|nr:PadR family transcriptional regulator [Niallia circulans]MCM2979550.1 PadR family transcriptional regulator [Niallia circulans]MED5100406.1 PadR family transcriptional regulator [Niallia circulans]PAD26701.1 hypothetical protein CHH62_04820 [Niallia circulans]PAD89995.1 hypothetical protein CHH55_00330 [Niallia circulans]